MESLLRSNTSREVDGYLQDWFRGEGEGGETSKTVIYITEEGRKHESCEENVRRNREKCNIIFNNLLFRLSVMMDPWGFSMTSLSFLKMSHSKPW